jgi:hypothetical protein
MSLRPITRLAEDFTKKELLYALRSTECYCYNSNVRQTSRRDIVFLNSV